MICCIIPTYRAKQTICNVVRGVLPFVDRVVVIDDACPEGSGDAVIAAFANHPGVIVITRPKNGGVGAATKTGLEKALDLDADVIIKIDADDQMDVSYIPEIVDLFIQDPDLALAKGNRFFDAMLLKRMPATRLFGNSWLSLFVKFASGYWNILDVTNGYLAFNGRLLPAVNWRSFSNSYFLEISVLCEYGLRRASIAEVQMDTIYHGAPSSMSIPRVLLSFPPQLINLSLRRLLLQYFLFDVNLGSLYILLGLTLGAFGIAFLVFQWEQSIATGLPRTTGTVMLGVLPFMMGFQLLLNALLFDVQFAPKCTRELLTVSGSKTSRRRGARFRRKNST